ncbi:hypothetical protein GCM10009612_22160 [Streptomyces beijiangensis]
MAEFGHTGGVGGAEIAAADDGELHRRSFLPEGTGRRPAAARILIPAAVGTAREGSQGGSQLAYAVRGAVGGPTLGGFGN